MSENTQEPVAQEPVVDESLKARSRAAVIKYGVARVVLFIVLTAVIQAVAMAIDAPVPLIFSALLALFVALPLSMLVFTKWRVEATTSLAELAAHRKAHKEWVARELSGR